MAKFVKGQIPWNKGIPCSDEAKVKISINRKGKKHTPEMQERLNINLKAGAATRFSKEQEPWNKGKKIGKQDDELILSRMKSKWLITHPDGKIEEVLFLSRWCEENNIKRHMLQRGKIEGFLLEKVLL